MNKTKFSLVIISSISAHWFIKFDAVYVSTSTDITVTPLAFANAVNSSLSVALPVNINNETLVSIAYSIMSYLLPTIAISPSLKRFIISSIP